MSDCKPNRGNILIVDDDRMNLTILSTILTKHGYQVGEAIG